MTAMVVCPWKLKSGPGGFFKLYHYQILEALDIVLGNDLDFSLACEGYVVRG
jgi:hypothetical protein